MEIIHTDRVEIVRRRQQIQRVDIFFACDGTATGVIVLKELGIPIHEYRAIESNSLRRKIVKCVLPEIVHMPPHDVNSLKQKAR